MLNGTGVLGTLNQYTEKLGTSVISSAADLAGKIVDTTSFLRDAEKNTKLYSVVIVSGGTTYDVTKTVVSMDRAEPKGQIAQRLVLTLANVEVGNARLSSLLKARSRVFVFANDGTKVDEVFRGYLWTSRRKDSTSENNIQYICYDNLIYFQESEDSLYFTAGKRTKDIVTTICEKWGIKLNYTYDNISHGKLPLRGYLSDIFTDVLDLVRKRIKNKYVILSEKDTMVVRPVGSNTTVYRFKAGENVITTASGWTMEGVITQVVITGKADDDGKETVEATVSGDTVMYGTLQKLQKKDEDTSLEDAKIEAKNTIDENGDPKWEYEITAPDVPWIRKGDGIYVSAGEIDGYKIVAEIDRTINLKVREMTLTLEDEL